MYKKAPKLTLLLFYLALDLECIDLFLTLYTSMKKMLCNCSANPEKGANRNIAAKLKLSVNPLNHSTQVKELWKVKIQKGKV